MQTFFIYLEGEKKKKCWKMGILLWNRKKNFQDAINKIIGNSIYPSDYFIIANGH